MSTLHLFTLGLTGRDSLEKMGRLSSPQDALLLLDEGIHWCLEAHWARLEAHVPCPVYVLQQQLLSLSMQASPNVSAISHEQWVELACRHERSLTWS